MFRQEIWSLALERILIMLHILLAGKVDQRIMEMVYRESSVLNITKRKIGKMDRVLVS